MKAQVLKVRDRQWFVCDYTGAFLQTRYFIPFGKGLRKKQGCYGTLPILLRAVLEQEGKEKMEEVKVVIENYYNQPDIPIQPPLAKEELPLSHEQFDLYLRQLDMGQAWLLLPKGAPIESATKSKKTKINSQE
jgi:hypothetical protein